MMRMKVLLIIVASLVWHHTAFAQLSQGEAQGPARQASGVAPKLTAQQNAALLESQPLADERLNNWVGRSQAAGTQESYSKLEQLYDKGKYDEAIKTAERLLAIKEKERGAPGPELSKLLLLMGGLYRAMSDFDKSEISYKRALAIRENALGPNHPMVAATLERYACLMRRRNRKDVADDLWARALDILRSPTAEAKNAPITGRVENGRSISLPQPQYPSQAKKMGVAGTVSVLVLVDVTGKPMMACTQQGPEVLALSAEDAAFKGLWTPTTLNKIPVRVHAPLIYNFGR